MGREIRFRAWDNVSKKMFYNKEFWILANNYYSVVERVQGVAVAITDNLNGDLMQFTGLLDKNNNPIYEGDIVECYDDAAIETPEMGKIHVGVIEYNAPVFSLKIPGKLIYDGGAVRQWANDVFLDQWDNAENIKVLGNIYEHPELLTP